LSRSKDGTTIGVLPGNNRVKANPYVQHVIATGIGEARNAIIVASADAVIAVGGEFGTLSEIAFALRAGKLVVGLDTWELGKDGQHVEGIVRALDPQTAVTAAIAGLKQ
jgi:uncharacterized protein (TIGR00725 family)